MYNKKLDTYIGVISYKRHENVKKLHKVLGTDQITWYVRPNEEKLYQNEGANTKSVIYKTVGDKRNKILEDGKNYDVIFMDDDIVRLRFAKNSKEEYDVTFETLVNEMKQKLKEVPGVKLCGVNSIAKPFFYNAKRQLSLTNFCVGTLLFVKKGSTVLHDTQFKMKEDYDFTLQHIKRYGGALRLNYVMVKAGHWNNKGGQTEIRTDELMDIDINKLRSKWGISIRLNPKRPHEILLSVK
jgi:hypothetical protein